MLANVTRRLAEVAKNVGVSEATVSRVLNGKPGISEATRQAVLTALDVLGYERPTKLRGERARLVGLVLPELQNPIFPAFAEVVAGALAQRGFTPGAVHPDRGRRLRGRLRGPAAGPAGLRGRLRRRAVRAGRRPHDHYRRLADRGLPVVLVNAAIDDLGFPRVSTDDAVAVQQAYRHLASLGHERIGLVLGPADHVPSPRKLAAFRPRRGSPARRCRTSRRADHVLHGGRPRRRLPADQARASPASSAPATCWRSARSGPPAGAGLAVPDESRWSATTTRPS